MKRRQQPTEEPLKLYRMLIFHLLLTIDSLSLKLLLLLWIIESSITHAVTKASNYMVYLTCDAGHQNLLTTGEELRYYWPRTLPLLVTFCPHHVCDSAQYNDKPQRCFSSSEVFPSPVQIKIEHYCVLCQPYTQAMQERKNWSFSHMAWVRGQYFDYITAL